MPMTFGFSRRWWVALAAVSLAAAPRAGAAQEKLDLAGALAAARAHALEVAAAGSRQQAAEARLRQAKSYRLPSLRLEEMWGRTDSPAEAFAFQLNQERFSFPQFVASDPNHPDPLTTGMTRLELTLPLYTGGELSGRVEQARLAAEAAGEQGARTADAAALAAAEAYVTLAEARESVALLETSRQTLAHHVELARAYVQQGMIVRSELLRAEVELARVEDLLAEARGGARVAEASLAFRLGADLASSWTLEPLPALPAETPPLAEWLAAAGSRADLEAARRTLAAGELEEKVRRAALFPRVGFTVRHDLYDDVPFGAHGDSTTVMAMAGIDLWNGGRHRAAAAAAKAEAEAGRRDVERMERGIRLEVQQAWEELQTALARRQTAGQSLDAAREAERIVEQRFRQGVAKTLDVIDATTARREAETRELVARAQAHLAAFRLAFKAGKAPESALQGESR
jgi:outer membrane protein